MEIEFFEYIFHLPSGESKVYKIQIDKATRTIIKQNLTESSVRWTDLNFHQCPVCPLSYKTTPKCPVAENLYSLIEVFGDQISYEKVDVEIISKQRTYNKATTLQIGLQSLFGLLMALSNCPKLSFLSSMAMFHLPFSSFEETILRAASFYLLKQYFKKTEGYPHDFSMNGLKKQYEDVEQVNQGFLERIQAIEIRGDASLNAINTLNAFAQMFSLQYELDLEALHYVFK